ncbi:MAG: hypothetical protein ABSE92_00280 [Terriglobales bacterium]|jgi:hypothetical protein
MRMRTAFLLLIGFGSNLWTASASTPPSQTARQALMEMFFSKQPGTFLNHLPAATRTMLEQSGALANLQQYSLLTAQIQTQSNNFQTFESGRILLTGVNPQTGQKVDVVVVDDRLRGEQDDIELSFEAYKDGQAQKSAFMPHLTFSMTTEAGIWKLSEISLTIHLPLNDPELLKSFAAGLKAHALAGSTSAIPSNATFTHAQTPVRTFGRDSGVPAAMRTILTAETTYAATYPSVGYTCTLSDLDGFGEGQPNEHQAMLIGVGLASGKWHGYTLALSGCSGSPATTFRLTATPTGESYGRAAFCADRAGAIRSSADGNAATCETNGELVK